MLLPRTRVGRKPAPTTGRLTSSSLLQRLQKWRTESALQGHSIRGPIDDWEGLHRPPQRQEVSLHSYRPRNTSYQSSKPSHSWNSMHVLHCRPESNESGVTKTCSCSLSPTTPSSEGDLRNREDLNLRRLCLPQAHQESALAAEVGMFWRRRQFRPQQRRPSWRRRGHPPGSQCQ
jgi:hypothetical protein